MPRNIVRCTSVYTNKIKFKPYKFDPLKCCSVSPRSTKMSGYLVVRHYFDVDLSFVHYESEEIAVCTDACSFP